MRRFARLLTRDPLLRPDIAQLLRSSGSVGANSIEANEALSKKDFVVRIKICRKEAKETGYWLRLLDTIGDQAVLELHGSLLRESRELTSIFGAVLRKTEVR